MRFSMEEGIWSNPCLKVKKNVGAKRLLKMFPEKIWGVMQESVYKKKIQDVDDLQKCAPCGLRGRK